jgi:hypothetical protein
MLHLLDDSLDAFLRATGPLPLGDIDVSFEPPDGDWAAGLSKPTVNLYLWRLRRSTTEATAGTELVERDGLRFRRGPRPRVELGYLVTAWAADARNAHQLLGRVLAAFLGTNELPPRFLQGALAQVHPPPNLSLSKADDDPPMEFWTALGGRFQPGVELTVTATIDPEVLVGTAPEPSVVETVVSDRLDPNRRSRRRRVAGHLDDDVAAGTIVRTPRGVATVDEEGAFLVAGEPGDQVVVETVPERRAVVPPAGPVTPTSNR